MIYHIVNNTDWIKALEQGYYEAASVQTEGFMHASLQHQLKGVLERYYAGQTDLVLLHINEAKLTAPLKYELSPSVNEEFPHLYGRLNLDAVSKTEIL